MSRRTTARKPKVPQPQPRKAFTLLVDDLIHEAKISALADLRGDVEGKEKETLVYKLNIARSRVLARMSELEREVLQLQIQSEEGGHHAEEQRAEATRSPIQVTIKRVRSYRPDVQEPSEDGGTVRS